eukprot:3978600-Amphidinium_carterae.1
MLPVSCVCYSTRARAATPNGAQSLQYSGSKPMGVQQRSTLCFSVQFREKVREQIWHDLKKEILGT